MKENIGGGRGRRPRPARSGGRRSGGASTGAQMSAQLAMIEKVLGKAQLALEKLRRARMVDAKSLSEPFTV